MTEDLVGRAVLVDESFVHEEDTRADILGKSHLVGDDEHGEATLG